MENNKSTSKIFRILIFIGVFIYFIIWGKNQYGHIDIEVIKTAIIGSSLAYFLSLIVSIIAKLTGNVVIGIIGTLIFIIVLLPKICKKLSVYVADDNQLYILIACVIIALIWDIISIIKIYKQPKQIIYNQTPDNIEQENGDNDIKTLLKNDPQCVLMYQEELENKLGRKPSYDEIMAYIETLELEEIDL